MAKRRRFLQPRKLPPDFARDYIIALGVLSRKHKDDNVAVVKQTTNLLKRMSKEAFLAGRGEIWIPSPDRLTGHYPVMEDIPYAKVRTALRKNTLKRRRAWDAVASSVRPFHPLRSTVSHVEKSLLPAVLTAVPFVKGRYPALLGKIVPGELEMLQAGAQTGTKSLIPIKRISPGEWSRGFQPLKFELDVELAEVYSRGFQYGLRAAWRRKRIGAFLKKHGSTAVTSALAAVVGGGLQRLHTEVGLPPTTVDLQPLQRTSLGKEFRPYPSTDLRGFRASLTRQLLKEMEGPTREAIEKQIGKINVELVQRGSPLRRGGE